MSCVNPLTDIEKLTIDAFNIIRPEMMRLQQLAFTEDQYGEKSTCNWDKINNIMYLNTYLMSIYSYIAKDYSNNKGESISYYIEKFKIQCIKENFKCDGYDITSLLNLYGLTTNSFNAQNLIIPSQSKTWVVIN